jgi:hypothetical protein
MWIAGRSEDSPWLIEGIYLPVITEMPANIPREDPS